MIKFFRRFHKQILIVGASFLMVAFLIQPVMSMFMASPQDRPIGRINGENIPIAERQTAAAELHALELLNPALGALANQLAEYDPEKWMLMVRDARQLGLHASRAQVDQLLYEVLGIDETHVQFAARQTGVTDDLVHQAARHWIVLEQYRALMLGQEHIEPFERLVRFVERVNLLQQAQRTGNIQLLMQLQQLRGMEQGSVRVSEPLVQWFIANHQATVSGNALLIDAERYLDQIDDPTDEQLQEQFERYRDVPRGGSEPFGFGYRWPDRVKLEWLAMPVDELRDQVEIDLVEIIEYYREHRDEFRDDADDDEAGDADEQDAEDESASPDEPNAEAAQRGTGIPREVRQEIASRLRDEQAQRLAQRMANQAHAVLDREARRLERDGRYRVIPEDFEPTSLDELADRLEEEHGVRPRVQRRVDEFVGLDVLEDLPGLGGAHIEGRPEVPLTDYVASTRELEPGDDDPLIALGFQVHVPGRVMARGDGSRYVFRLSGARPSQPPETLDEVRDQVERDVRHRLAYDRLEQEMDAWQQRAEEEGFEALAEREHVRLQRISPTPRRTFMGVGDELDVPFIPGIGANEQFVDTMFDIAERVSDFGRDAVDEAPESERIGAISIAPEMSVAVFRVDAYHPVTRSEFEQQAEGPMIEMALSQLLAGVADDPLFADEQEPALSKEAVARRLGFESIELEDLPEPDAPAPPQRRPGQL